VFEEGGDEVAEEGLSVGGFAAEMAVFHGSAGHDGEGCSRMGKIRGGGERLRR
jgi:hypothetical protein